LILLSVSAVPLNSWFFVQLAAIAGREVPRPGDGPAEHRGAEGQSGVDFMNLRFGQKNLVKYLSLAERSSKKLQTDKNLSLKTDKKIVD
jgi:hypothetical protein